MSDLAGWHRLDPRMLVVGPISALRQFAVPALIGLLGYSSSQGSVQWWIIPVALVGALLVGALPWLTTRYVIADDTFQLRTGLLNKRKLTAPLDRVRSVDLESSLLHRVLGLAKVKVGTGVDDTQIELDSLGTSQAEALQRELLARRRAAVATATPLPADDGHAPPPDVVPEPAEHLLATLDWSWVRFAPLSLTRLAVLAGALGFLSQFVDDVPVFSWDRTQSWWDTLIGYGWPLVVAGAVVVGLVVWVLVAIAGYALQWGGLRLVRDGDTVRLSAGLLSTRSTAVEEARIRGVELVEPTLMRLVDGAELSALATGVGDGGTSQLLPPSPLAENHRVGALVLGSQEPLTVALTRHGPRARRRRYVQFVSESLTVAVVLGVLTAVFDWAWWIPLLGAAVAAPVLAGMAELSYRNLGHAMTVDHLVSGTGLLSRRRTALERDGVIGWVIEQSFFQRRAGLATLVATTAAGSEKVPIVDVRHDLAVALAAQITPGAVTDFTEPASVA